MLKVAGAAAFLGLAALAFLYLHPIEIKDRVFNNGDSLQIGGIALELDSLKLSFDGRFLLQAGDVRLSAQHRDPAAPEVELGRAFVTLDFWQLLRLRAAPTTVSIDRLAATVEIGEEGIDVAGLPLSSADRDAAAKPAPWDEERERLWQLALAKLHDPPRGENYSLEKLQAIEFAGTQIEVYDKVRGARWEIEDLDLLYSRLPGEAAVLRFKLRVARDDHEAPPGGSAGAGYVLPVEVALRSQPGQQDLAFEIAAAADGSQFLRGYVDEPIAAAVNSPVSVRAAGWLRSMTLDRRMSIEINAEAGRFSAPALYAAPREFESLAVRAEYDAEEGTLQLESLEYVDGNKLKLTLQGSLQALFDEPIADLTAELAPVSVEQLAAVFPDAAMPGTTDWLKRNLRKAAVSGARIELRGRLADFAEPQPDLQPKLAAQFSFSGLEVTFWEKLPPGRNIDGDFRLQDGVITVSSAHADLSQQSVSDLTVVIADLFGKGRPPRLTVRGKLNGPLEDVAGAIERAAAASIPFKQSGRQSSELELALPLAAEDGNLPFELSLAGRVENYALSFSSDAGKAPEFTGEIERLTVKDNRLSAQAAGRLFGQPAAVEFSEDLGTFGQTAVVSVSGEIDPALFGETAVGRHLAAAGGPAAVTVSLAQRGRGRYEMTSAIDWSALEVAFEPFGWQKPQGANAELAAHGALSAADDKLQLELEEIKASAPGLSLAGTAGLDLGNPANAVVEFPRVVVGRSVFSLQYKRGAWRISGEHLVLADLLAEKGDEGKQAPQQGGGPLAKLPALDLAVDLKSLTVGERTLYNPVLRVLKDAAQWRKLSFRSDLTLKGKSAVVGNLETGGGEDMLRITAEDAGSVARLLGLKTRVSDGRVDARVEFRRFPDLDGAHGRIKVENVKVKESPLLLQILSFLSLERYLRLDSGVQFSLIRIPFAIKGRELAVKELRAAGPIITLFLNGTMHLDTKKLAGEGQAVPLDRLQRITRKVPLVGKTIYNAQRQITGASFKLSGTTNNPEVKYLGEKIVRELEKLNPF